MKHVVFFSGGSASWYVAHRLKEKYGSEKIDLVFTDTLIEDNDLYRFIIESSSKLYGVYNEDIKELMAIASSLTEAYEDMDKRKVELEELRLKVIDIIPNFYWLSEQRDVWDVFYKKRFLGNSRLAQCSHELKQKMANKFIKKEYEPENTILYLGIDWTEEHRAKAPIKNWAPFKVEFPLIEDLSFNKIDIIKELEKQEIELCNLYKLDFSHNNCGGFCVRAGQGHFANLLSKNRKLYLYHEKREKEFIQWIDKDVAILKRSRTNRVIGDDGEEVKEKIIIPLTLEQLRMEIESNNSSHIDMLDIGGCGCFLADNEDSD